MPLTQVYRERPEYQRVLPGSTTWDLFHPPLLTFSTIFHFKSFTITASKDDRKVSGRKPKVARHDEGRSFQCQGQPSYRRHTYPREAPASSNLECSFQCRRQSVSFFLQADFASPRLQKVSGGSHKAIFSHSSRIFNSFICLTIFQSIFVSLQQQIHYVSLSRPQQHYYHAPSPIPSAPQSVGASESWKSHTDTIQCVRKARCQHRIRSHCRELRRPRPSTTTPYKCNGRS